MRTATRNQLLHTRPAEGGERQLNASKNKTQFPGRSLYEVPKCVPGYEASISGI